jgi:hypothetical protein
MHLYEDLISINRSPKLIDAVVNRKDRVLNVQNKRHGVSARRGDGTFGELIPGETALIDSGYVVARGPIATVEIGVEVKILAKAMIKQIDRVKNDLHHQIFEFKRGGGSPICLAVIGINQAETTTGYEGDRPWPTTGKGGFLHPFQEAPEAESAACALRLSPNSMSFLCYGSRRRMRHLIPSSGSTIPRPGWIMPQHCHGLAPATSSGSDHTFLRKSKSHPRFACVTCSRNMRP